MRRLKKSSTTHKTSVSTKQNRRPLKSVPKQTSQPQEDSAPPSEAPPEDPVIITPEQRLQMIQETAYLKAEARGFAPDAEMDDWLAAEAEVDDRLGAG